MVNKNDKVLRPANPNKGIEVAYRRKLEALIDQMNRSVLYWLSAAFKADTPVMTELTEAAIAVDAKTPAKKLQAAVKKLALQWGNQFDASAPELADWFAQSAASRSKKNMQAILKKGGWSVDFKPTKAQQDILQATVVENVSLIKSIPSEYFTRIEGLVMRSVTTGRDLQQLTVDLRKQFGVTRRRAELISRDQNNKATASFTRARQLDLGIQKAIWQHSGAGKHPRPSHIKMNGKEYDVAKGMWDPHEHAFVFPGILVNCRCTSRSLVKGFS